MMDQMGLCDLASCRLLHTWRQGYCTSQTLDPSHAAKIAPLLQCQQLCRQLQGRCPLYAPGPEQQGTTVMHIPYTHRQDKTAQVEISGGCAC